MQDGAFFREIDFGSGEHGVSGRFHICGLRQGDKCCEGRRIDLLFRDIDQQIMMAETKRLKSA